MGRIIDKINIATGRDSSNRFDLSCYHATTTDFYSPRLTYFKEFVPGEKWNIDARCSVRCLPMIKPTIADITVHNRFFFVPYFTIMDTWNEFLSESPVTKGSLSAIPSVPYCYEYDIISAIVTVSSPPIPFTYAIPVSDPDAPYDFDANGASWKFTKEGRIIYSILNGLGFVINSTRTSSSKGNKINLLGLLSYLKVYLDWFNNSAFATKRRYEAYFSRSLDKSMFLSSEIRDIFDAICTMYLEKDYFTSASLYPVGTNQSIMQSHHTIPDITMGESSVVSTPVSTSNHGTPYINSSTNVSASKYSIDAVNALTDYVKRHQLAGIQPFNRILAEYGVTLDDEVLRRSTFIGDVEERLDIQTIVSTSYADDTVLGERNGIAQGGGNKSLSYSNDNFGCIICITTVVPKLSYVDGLKRSILRNERFDFFTPSMEHLGTEPIYVAELFNNLDGQSEHSSFEPGAIFGYMPRYASYKTALDTLSGDFMLASRREMYDPWVLRRTFRHPNMVSEYLTQSENFLVANGDKVNDIFLDEEMDNFIIFNMYHVTSRLPMHKLFDDYQWSNEDDNPQHVTLPNQGVQLT